MRARILPQNLRKGERLLVNPAQNDDKRRMERTTTTANRLGLSTSEAARALGVSLSTIRRWSDSGALRGYRTPGGQRRFSQEQIDAFLASLEHRRDAH